MRLIGLAVALTLGLTLAPLTVETQQQIEKMYRIGYLGNASASAQARWVESLRAALRDLGYVEGKNIVIEFRWAEGRYDRLPDLAAELVRLKVDVLVTAGTPGTLAAKQATTTIPIVMVGIGDAVALFTPDGNAVRSRVECGMSRLFSELIAVVAPTGFEPVFQP